MSLAQSLVESLAEIQTDIDDTTLVIDPYSRQIIIPKSVTTLGVEHDDDVLRLDFRVPRYITITDLSQFAVRINYINAQGESDVYYVNNASIRVTQSYLEFSWLVGPTATAYKGSTSFIVCMVETKSDGTILREFNTTVASLPVLQGLEVDPSVVTDYSDIIEQWRQELFGIGNTEEANMRAVSQEEQDNIAQKGAQVLASIPEDYTTTFNGLEKAARTKADAIVCSASGNAILVADSSDDGLRGLKLFGKTTQKSTTGKNLLKVTAVNTSVAGITYTVNPDGTVLASGTASDTSTLVLNSDFKYTAGVGYTLNGCPSGGGVNTYRLDDVSKIADDGLGGSVVYTEDTTAQIRVRIAKGATVNNLLFKPMIRLTSIADDSFEPYTGGVPSPSPEWPQEMVDIEGGDFVIYGGNIANAIAIEKGANASAIASEDGYTLTVTGGADKPYTSSPIQLPMEYLRGKTLHLKADKIANSHNSGGKGGNVQLNIRSAATGMKYVAISPNNLHAVTTVPDDVIRIDLNIYTNNSNELFDTANTTTVEGLMLSIADIPWEPYQDPQYFGWNDGSSTHWIYSGVPVLEGGNYTDESGQQWICDEVEFVDYSGNIYSTFHQRIHTLTLDGSENISLEERTGGTYRFIIRPATLIRAIPLAGGFCSHFTWGLEPIGDNSKDRTMCMWNTGNVYCRCDDIASVDAMVEWLAAQKEAGTPVTIKYVLESEIGADTNPGLVEEYKKLHTNYPSTTLFNRDGAGVELKYNADTKTWFENLPKANDDQVVAAVNAWLSANFPNAEGVSF